MNNPNTFSYLDLQGLCWIPLSQFKISRQRECPRQERRRRHKGSVQRGYWQTQRWIIFAPRMNWPFSSMLCWVGTLSVCLCMCVCVCHASARGDSSICPVKRPCRLVWREKPVQICVAALCMSHWIWWHGGKEETSRPSHGIAPLFCWWRWRDERRGRPPRCVGARCFLLFSF